LGDDFDGIGDSSVSFPFPLLWLSVVVISNEGVPKDKPRRRRCAICSPSTCLSGVLNRFVLFAFLSCEEVLFVVGDEGGGEGVNVNANAVSRRGVFGKPKPNDVCTWVCADRGFLSMFVERDDSCKIGEGC